MPKIVELAPNADGTRVYRVEGKQPGQVALVHRHGNLDHLLTCLRCRNTRDFSFACQHIEAVATSQYMRYED